MKIYTVKNENCYLANKDNSIIGRTIYLPDESEISESNFREINQKEYDEIQAKYKTDVEDIVKQIESENK